MNKASKGALAIGTAGVLLMGGAGSLAYWSDAGTVAGSSITSGHLKLTPAVGGACTGWKFDGGTAYTPSTNNIVPGDVLTQICTYTVDAKGEHITASFNVAGGALTGAAGLTSDLTVAATYQVNSGTPGAGSNVTVVNGDVITAKVTATFKTTAVNASEDLSAALSDITITASQNHAG
jgi:alternate signal-mediated exported protein